jgi:hypothetical protein
MLLFRRRLDESGLGDLTVTHRLGSEFVDDAKLPLQTLMHSIH